jgi:iron complex outermembrane receptor protein
VNAAQFFTNAIDTETKGLDVVISHNARFSGIKLDNNFAINLNQTKQVGDIHSSGLLHLRNLKKSISLKNPESIWKKQCLE